MGKSKLPVLPSYDCGKCPAYCCTYPEIDATPSDIARLSAHFGVKVSVGAKRFTKRGSQGDVILRHVKDELFGSRCMFLDPEFRRCTVYPARPAVCRSYPGKDTCAYFELLLDERYAQKDPAHVVRVRHD